MRAARPRVRNAEKYGRRQARLFFFWVLSRALLAFEFQEKWETEDLLVHRRDEEANNATRRSVRLYHVR